MRDSVLLPRVAILTEGYDEGYSFEVNYNNVFIPAEEHELIVDKIMVSGGERAMRKCIRCETNMIEDFDVRDRTYGWTLKVTRPDTEGVMPKNNFGYIKAAVCPECGYVETYLSRLDKIKRE